MFFTMSYNEIHLIQYLFSQVTFKVRANHRAPNIYIVNAHKCYKVYEDEIELKAQNKWKTQKIAKLVFPKISRKSRLEGTRIE